MGVAFECSVAQPRCKINFDLLFHEFKHTRVTSCTTVMQEFQAWNAPYEICKLGLRALQKMIQWQAFRNFLISLTHKQSGIDFEDGPDFLLLCHKKTKFEALQSTIVLPPTVLHNKSIIVQLFCFWSTNWSCSIL